LLARLRRLEGVVQSLGKNVDDDESVEDKMSEAGRKAQAVDPVMNGGGEVGKEGENSVATDIRCKRKGSDTRKLEKDFGRLVVEEGRSRYVSNSFWASLSDEVCATSLVPISVAYTTLKERLRPGSRDERHPRSYFR